MGFPGRRGGAGAGGQFESFADTSRGKSAGLDLLTFKGFFGTRNPVPDPVIVDTTGEITHPRFNRHVLHREKSGEDEKIEWSYWNGNSENLSN